MSSPSKINQMRVRSRRKVKAMRKFKDAVLSKLASNSNPSIPLPMSSDLSELRMHRLFPSFHTPSHPPYALMIQQAILKLNEEGGSTEEVISRFLEKEYQGLPWEHASFLSHHLKKLSGNREIACVDNERYKLQVDDVADSGYEVEMTHRLNIPNRDVKEDRTVEQGKGREVEATDGWSGVNSDQAEESVDQCEVERENVEVITYDRACGQRTKGFEEQKEITQELIEEVQEESQSFSGQIEVVKEVIEAKGNLVKVAQEQRGKKRKQPEMPEQQKKVLKDDVSKPVREEKKKYVNEHKLHQRERGLIIVCALPAIQQSKLRTKILQRAHKLSTELISASMESSEFEERPAKILTRRQIKNSQLKAKTSIVMSKNVEELEENQEQQFHKPEKHLEFEINTREADFGGEEAAISLSIEVKDSINVPLDPGQHGKEHQKKQMKVYVRRNRHKSQLKE